MSTGEERRRPGEDASERTSRILVVDDEEVIRRLLTEVLAEEGYWVTTVSDGQQAIDLLERERFNLIITDMVMPGVSGIEVLRAAQRIDPQCPVVVLTGYPSVDSVRRLVRLGASDYIAKPFNVDVLRVTVAKLLEMRRVREELTDEDTRSP